MPSRSAGLVVLVTVVVLAAGCRKSEPAAGTKDGGGPIVVTAPDGAPLVGPAASEPFVPGGGPDPGLRACRVAMRRPDWGPGGNLGSLQFKLRTVRARGTRDEVLKVAHEQMCQEDGVPAERCTAALFLKEYEWCDGDPRPEPRPLTPELQQLADQIRSGAKPIPADAGPAPTADAGPAEAVTAPPATAPDGAQMVY